MKLTQSTVQKNFVVKHKNKTYYVDFMDSDGYISGFIQPGWQILDEELEELNIYVFNDTTKKELKQIKKNLILYNKLINFCIKHFNEYKPDYKDC
jgi:hypothetical protein